MKKFAFIVGIVVVGAALVAGGYWLGIVHRFMAEAYSANAMDKALADASWQARTLHYLDAGNVGAARSLLRSRLDSEIMTIWLLGDYSDPRSCKMATNVLAGIMAFRAEYPSNYTARPSGFEADIDAKIAAILAEAKKAATQ